MRKMQGMSKRSPVIRTLGKILLYGALLPVFLGGKAAAYTDNDGVIAGAGGGPVSTPPTRSTKRGMTFSSSRRRIGMVAEFKSDSRATWASNSEPRNSTASFVPTEFDLVTASKPHLGHTKMSLYARTGEFACLAKRVSGILE